MNTQRLYDYVLESVFGVYLLDPAALDLRLTEVKTSLRVTAAGLEFNLPDLYDFALFEAQSQAKAKVGGDGNVDGNVRCEQSYTSFRRCLYGQQTQVMLHTLGGEVVIAHNHHHVNKSIYRLQALS